MLLLSNKFETDQLFYYVLNILTCCQNQPSCYFKVWTFFKCFDRDLRELKQNNKFDTDQLFYYILNIQKMCHENQPSGFFKVWTFFRCFDRELMQNNKFDTDQLFHYILNIHNRSLVQFKL